jgi:hypothetical protein
MAQEKKYARELLEMAQKEFEGRTINDASEYVFSMAAGRELPWARYEVLVS